MDSMDSMALSWFLVAALCFASSAHGQEGKKPTLAVLVLGDAATSVAEVGRLQHELAARLAPDQTPDQTPEALSTETIASRLGQPPRAAVTSTRASEIRAHLDVASAAISSGDLKLATKAIAEADAALGPALHRGHALRVELELWRVGLHLAAQEKGAARSAATRALELDPELTVDLGTYWPSLADLVTETRAQLTLHRVRLEGLPSGASLWVNGRRSKNPFETFAASPLLRLEAAGFLPLETVREVTGSKPLALAPALAIDPDVHQAILANFERRPASLDSKLRSLANKLGVERLVVVRLGSGEIAAIDINVAGGASRETSPRFAASQVDEFYSWLAARPASRELRAPPREVPTVASPSSEWTASLTLLPLFRSDQTSWAQAEVSADRLGARLAAAVFRAPKDSESGWTLGAMAGVGGYGLSEVTARNLENTDLDVGGGWKLQSQVRGGYAASLPWRFRGRLRLWTAVEASYLGDPSAEGAPLGVLAGFVRLSGGAALGIDWVGHSSIVSADLSVGLFNVFLSEPESPTGAEVSSDGAARLEAVHWVSARWGVGGAIVVELLSSDYDEAGESGAIPAPVGAARVELGLGLGLTVNRRL